MAKRCQITGKGVMTGNNVSHAKNRTRRRFLPNLQQTSMESEILGRSVSLRVSTSAIRTIEKHGGLDAFLMQARNAELADDARALKREMLASFCLNAHHIITNVRTLLFWRGFFMGLIIYRRCFGFLSSSNKSAS